MTYEVEITTKRGKTQTVEFDNEPSEQDIDEVANQIDLSEPSQLQAETAGESFKQWAEKRGGQIKEGKYVRGIGGGLIDVLGTIGSRPAQAITAGIQAKRTGQGGFLDTLGKYLASGDVRDVQGKDISDVTYGWEPENISGKALKAGLNIGRDILGIGGQLKGLSALTKIKGLSKIPGAIQAGEQLYKTGKAIGKVENIADPLLQKALAPVAEKTGQVVSKAVDEAPDWVKKIGQNIISPKFGVKKETIAMGQEVKNTKNYFSNLTNEIHQNAKASTQGLLPDFLSTRKMKAETAVAKERLGRVLIGEVKPATDAEKIAREAFINKNQQIMGKLSELRGRLKNVGIDNAMEETFYRVVPSDKYYHRMYKLAPGTDDPENVAKIVTNINKKIASYESRITKGTADDPQKAVDAINTLKRLKKAYLKNDSKGVKAMLDENNLLSDNALPSNEKAFGIGEQGSLRARILPDYIADVFDPAKDYDAIMSHANSMDNLMARLEAQVKMIEKDPTKAFGYTTRTGKNISDHFRRWEESGVFRGIENIIPSIRTDNETYRYMGQLLGEQNIAEKFLSKMGPIDKFVRSTWKNFMLRTPPAVFRNHVDTYLARGAHYGIELPDYMNGVNTALKVSKGQVKDIPPALKNVYYKLNGQMSTMRPSPLGDILDVKGIKIPEGTAVAKPKSVASVLNKVWDDLGHHFRASDDGLRISMFNKKVQELTGQPLQTAVRNENAVTQAIKFVNDNTVVYDELPALARFIQVINPFFSFNWRAPKQYLKAAVRAPTLTAKTKAAFSRESERNLEQMNPKFRKIYEAAENPLANAISPFGGDVFLGEGKSSTLEGPTVEKISMAPYSFAMRRATPENYAPDTGMQIKDVAAQMSGIPVPGQTLAPVTPFLALYNVIQAAQKGGDLGLKEASKTFLPKAIPDAMKAVPFKAYNVFGGLGRALASAVYPRRGGGTERGLLNLGGVKVEQTAMQDIYKNVVNAINLQRQEEINKIEEEIKRYGLSPDESIQYRREEMEKRMPKFERQLQRILKAIE